MGCLSKFDVDGCGCTCASPTFTGTIIGCNSLSIAGATIEAHDATSGGTLLGSTTSIAGGTYSLSGLSGQISGNSIVLVFVRTGFSKTLTFPWTAGSPNSSQWSCGATTSVGTTTLTVATGYHCLGGYSTPSTLCADPLPNVLHGTHSFFGAVVLNWTVANHWNGALSYSYPGCTNANPCSCASKTVTVTFDLGIVGATLAIGVSWKYTSNIFVGSCPEDSGTSVNTDIYAITAFTCPSSLSITGTIAAGSDNGGNRCMMCVLTGSVPSRTLVLTP